MDIILVERLKKFATTGLKPSICVSIRRLFVTGMQCAIHVKPLGPLHTQTPQKTTKRVDICQWKIAIYDNFSTYDPFLFPILFLKVLRSDQFPLFFFKPTFFDKDLHCRSVFQHSTNPMSCLLMGTNRLQRRRYPLIRLDRPIRPLQKWVLARAQAEITCD